LHAFLRKRHMLLVLDNFEQLLDAAPDIAALLASSSTLSILATSRVPLRLLGEREYPLGPLALPSEDEPHPLAVHATRDPASFGPAVQLFTDRAQAVRPDFVLTDENSAAVTAICRRLDGLPLAIELAAARVRMFSASALLARLETGGGLPLLTRGARDMPARQQTIRATLDWSYRLLPPGEQVMLARLGVFMNGFTLEAAEAVAGDTALGGLDVLIEHSLVRVIRKSDGEPRFGMLETVREYALEQLNASGEAETLKTAHMTYYLALAELAEPHLNDAEQEEWLERLEAEHDNLRAALQWSLLRHRTEQALRLSGALWRFWRMRGYHTEGRRWLEAALAVTPPRNGADRERPFPAARAKALAGACIMAHYQGDYSRATVFGGESLALSRRLGDQRGIAAALYGLALVARSGGNYTAACAMYQESLSISRELGDVAGTAFSLCRLGIVHLFATEFAAARPVLEESLALYKQLEDQEGLAIVIHCLGYTSWGEGDTTTAWRLLSEALATFRALGSRRYIAHSLSVLGRVAAGDRNAAVARPLIEEGLGLLNELGDRLEIASALDALADAAAQLGLATWAVQLMGAASVLYDALGSFERRKMYLMAYERALAAAHAQLGEQEFASAWEVGRAMTPQQAIAAQDTQQLGQSDPAQHVPAALQRPGLTELTARELDVLRLVAKGLTNAQVAEQLVVSQRTVHAHLRSIYSKLDVASRTAAARFALDHKLL
jgi:predicted ATPase/DNA-binding CsgD family transcriptional regulator